MKSDTLSKSKFNNYGFIFGIFLTLKMFLNMPFGCTEMTDPWAYLFYITEYKTIGFVPRALLGTVCGFFTDFISWKTIYIIAVFTTVLLIVFASLLFGKVVDSVPKGQTAILLFACLFLLMADDIFYFFDKRHFGCIDTYFIILTLAAVVFAGHKKLRWLVPVICLLCMADYEGYVFAYMPLLGIILLYYCFKEKSNSSIAVFVLSCLAIIISFLYFYAFFRQDMLNMVLCETPEEMKSVLSKHSDAEICWMIEQLYYFTGAGTFFIDGSWEVPKEFFGINNVRLECMPSALVLYFCILPLWLKVRKNEADKRMKFIYFLCMIAPVSFIPFQVFSEQMKYISYFIVSQFILLLFFAVKEADVSEKLSELEEKFIKNPVIGIIPACLMLFFRALW